ncbi:MAG: YjgN family protein [Luteimonas sp.]
MLDVMPAAPAGSFNAPGQLPDAVRHRPQFSGTTGEYFGIWFVNLLLSIVTLGIYSAWAKVRTQRYFYANTQLAGASFEYLASPVSILKGRLIAYAVVIALVVSSKFAPMLYLFLLAVVGLLMPMLIVLSLRFRARNSAWRGLTFRFDEEPASAYGPFLLWGWLTGLTLSLLYPVMKKRQHEFVVEGHRFGHKRFTYKGSTGAYYAPYGIAFALVVAVGVAMAITIGNMAPVGADKSAIAARLMITLGAFYLVVFGVAIFLRVRYANLLWNSSQLGPHDFHASARARDLLWIYASNGVAILCTIGLAIPWARIRLARYRAEHFSMLARGDLDEFVAASESRAGAAGSELVDALDMGLDIGL